MSLILVLSLSLLAATIQLINLSGAPQRTALEGSNTAQAWTLLNLDKLNLADVDASPLTYSWPPLGWWQLAGLTSLSGAFQRYDGAVFAGREAMLVAHLVAIPLLWMLARRLGFTRPFATAAVALYALAPLALHAHRTVAFANLATPWLLGAWVLALAPRRQSLAFAASSLCFGLAVLTEPSYLLFLPLLAWSMWTTVTQGFRAVRLSLAAVVLAGAGVGYLLLARALGWALPGEPPSFDAVIDAASRTAEALFSSPTGGVGVAVDLVRLDPVLVVLALLGAVVCLVRRSLRPLALALIGWAILLFTPVGLAAASIHAIIAVAVLLSAGAAEILFSRARRLDANAEQQPRWGARSVAVVVALGVVVAGAVPLWGSRLDGLLRVDQNRPMAQAQGWIDANVARDSALIVGPEIWVDLVRAGFSIDNIASNNPNYALAEPQDSPTAWRTFDYVIATESGPDEPSPIAVRALDNSHLVAQFGGGDQAVRVHRVLPNGDAEYRKSQRADKGQRRSAGAELVRNPSLRMSKPVRDLVADGQLDPRALVLLPRAATTGALRISALPEIAGEAGNGQPRRQVLISGRDGAFLSTEEGEKLAKIFTEQNDKYRPASVTPRAGSLLLTWSLDYPLGLFA